MQQERISRLQSIMLSTLNNVKSWDTILIVSQLFLNKGKVSDRWQKRLKGSNNSEVPYANFHLYYEGIGSSKRT